MPAKRREATGRVAVPPDCRHYWIIDSSQQVESRGRCQLCGEERVFQNKLSAARKQGAAVDSIPADGPVLPPDDDPALRQMDREQDFL